MINLKNFSEYGTSCWIDHQPMIDASCGFQLHCSDKSKDFIVNSAPTSGQLCNNQLDVFSNKSSSSSTLETSQLAKYSIFIQLYYTIAIWAKRNYPLCSFPPHLRLFLVFSSNLRNFEKNHKNSTTKTQKNQKSQNN